MVEMVEMVEMAGTRRICPQVSQVGKAGMVAQVEKASGSLALAERPQWAVVVEEVGIHLVGLLAARFS
jgi:hypothetical protein